MQHSIPYSLRLNASFSVPHWCTTTQYSTRPYCCLHEAALVVFPYKQDLNSETLLHIDAESKQQSLEEELRFLKTIHEQVRCRHQSNWIYGVPCWSSIHLLVKALYPAHFHTIRTFILSPAVVGRSVVQNFSDKIPQTKPPDETLQIFSGTKTPRTKNPPDC